jgi:hypothetical protein
MALVDYMGDAPGFMSYRRQPTKNMTAIPQRQVPAQKEFKQEDYDIKAEGLPGDKQVVYNQQKSFNDGLKSLYNQYGGEMDWVTSDPRYKELVKSQAYAVYSADAAVHNEENVKARKTKLNDENSGHHGSDLELVRNQDGTMSPKIGGLESGYLNKEQFVQHVSENPNYKEMPDGSLGIGYVDFDESVGSGKAFHEMLDGVYKGGALGVTRNARSLSETENTKVTEGMNFAVNHFVKHGRDYSANFDQLQDATDYLLRYGMNESQETFLWQSFFKDAQKGREFNMPKLDENGKVVTKDGQMVMDKIYPTDADLNDPAKKKVLFNVYVQDRIIDYSKKFKTSSSERDDQERFGYQNFDPGTGQPIVNQQLPWWANVQSGQGPAGEGFKKKETYPTSSTSAYSPSLSGNPEKLEGDVIVYNRSNTSSQYMDQAEKSLIGNTLGEISDGGHFFVGKHRQPLGGLKDVTISKVKDIRQVPSGKMVKDPKTGKMVPGTTWAARVFIAADDDSDLFDNLEYWDGADGSIKPIATEGFFGTDYNDEQAQHMGYIVEMDRSIAESDKLIINGDEGSSLGGGSLLGGGSGKVKGIWADIPVSGYTMAGFDQAGRPESQKWRSEKIQVGASQKAHAIHNAQNQRSQYGQSSGAVWVPKK